MKNIFELEKYFQKESTLEEVLKYCTQFFTKIDNVMLDLRKNKIQDGESVQEALTKVTGYFGALKPVLALAITEKKNRQVRYYNTRKEQIEKEGEKFSSAPTEREADASVASYRRVRNLVQGYVEVADRTIGILQSKLNYLKQWKE